MKRQSALILKVVPLVAACLFLCVASGQDAGRAANVTLSLGDAPPSIESGRLIKGDAFPVFEAGKVYFLDFWATNCGPCVKAMPHLAELATKYQDRVTFISVNVEKILNGGMTDDALVQQVAEFMKHKGHMLNYTVLMDGKDQSIQARWLDAAGKFGVPVAYIVVDKQIVWMADGGATAIPPLAEVVAGTYKMPSRAKFMEQQFAEAQDMAEMQRLTSYPPLVQANKAGDHSVSLGILEQAS